MLLKRVLKVCFWELCWCMFGVNLTGHREYFTYPLHITNVHSEKENNPQRILTGQFTKTYCLCASSVAITASTLISSVATVVSKLLVTSCSRHNWNCLSIATVSFPRKGDTSVVVVVFAVESRNLKSKLPEKILFQIRVMSKWGQNYLSGIQMNPICVKCEPKTTF